MTNDYTKKLASKVLGFFGLNKKDEDMVDTGDSEEQVKITIQNTPESEKLPWTFEVSWDVVDYGHQICTNIDNGEKNILIGPYRPHRVLTNEIYEADFPAGSRPAMAVEAIRAQGIHVITGKWKVRNLPPGILFDIESARNKVGNDYIKKFKREHRINVPDGDLVCNDAVVFGYIVAEFLAQFESSHSPSTINNDVSATPQISDPVRKMSYSIQNLSPDLHSLPVGPHSEPEQSLNSPSIIPPPSTDKVSSDPVDDSRTCALFHDWKCGIGLMLVHKLKIPITKCFTLNNILLKKGNFESHIQANEEALRRGIHHRFSIEYAATQSADIFSSVGETLATQAEVVHQRKPDFVIIPHSRSSSIRML